jgi:hypothetical protein
VITVNLYDLYTDALEKVAKNVPTSPEKWARAKAQARAKFDVYPSAYANGWAAKKYKSMGGGWKKEAELTKEAVVSTKDLIIPGAVGAATGLLISHKRKKAAAKKTEHSKEAFVAGVAGRALLGAGKILKKPVSRFMLGKKGLTPQKRGAHLMKRVGQVGTAATLAGGAAGLAKRVATKKISTAKAPSVNNAAPPPSIQ